MTIFFKIIKLTYKYTISVNCEKGSRISYYKDACYTSQLKFSFLLDESVSRDARQYTE